VRQAADILDATNCRGSSASRDATVENAPSEL
jgi:hypothetical protein